MNRIRRLQHADLEAAVRITNEAILRGESTQGPDAIDEQRLSALLFAGGERFEAYVCENDAGDVTAWGALVPHTGRSVYNVSGELEVFVGVAHRRRGVGRALVRHLMGRARELDFHALLLLLQPEPTHVMSWAVKLGFRCVGSLAAVLPVNEEWRDLLVFEIFLSPPRSA